MEGYTDIEELAKAKFLEKKKEKADEENTKTDEETAEEIAEEIDEDLDEIILDDLSEKSDAEFICEKKGVGIVPLIKYFVAIGVSLIYWEMIMAVEMGGINGGTFFLLFFIPAIAAFFTAFCGFGNKISSRITYPLVLLLPAVYYIIQTVYLTNFGSLFSISMTAMGTDAMGDFGWAVTDSIVEAIPVIVFILLPVILSVVVSIVSAKNLLSFISPMPYKAWMHAVVLAGAVILWGIGVLGIRMFGSERPAPYYLLTSNQVTTDLAARKLGVMTTAVVEGGSYYFGFGSDEEGGFSYDEDDEEFVLADMEKSNEIKVIPQGMTEDEMEQEPEIVRVPWINDQLDFEQVMNSADNNTTKDLAEFFLKRKPSETNEYTGMFEGYNLIYICAESFWNYACNEEVTPTLYKMANGGIVLNNYYNSFFNTTTNGEYAFDTSLWPDVSRNSKNGTDVGSFAQSASKFMPQGLGDLFTAQGIPSYAFHNYYGKYYRRILSWPNLGYKCRFTGDGMWFTSNWPASDLELMQQSVDDYINDEQFHAYYMTFSGHGPYTAKNHMFNKNLPAVNEAVGEDKYHIDARGYFAGELELDMAMEYLLKRLEEAGKLDNTVIVIAADHYPYYLSDEGRISLAGYDIDQNFDIYKSSCVIYNAGMEPMQVNNYCSNVDIAPTILNLFNIPFDSRLMMGRDIFSEQAHNRGTLYNMSFISDYVRYNYETGEAVWTAEGEKLSEADKEKYIKSNLQNIENEYTAACKVIEDNFFFKAYEACNLLTPEEISEEKAREEKVRSQDETYNAEDEEAQMLREMEKQQEEEAAAAQLLLQQMQNGMLPEGTVVPDPANPGAATPVTDPNAGNVPGANEAVNPLNQVPQQNMALPVQ